MIAAYQEPSVWTGKIPMAALNVTVSSGPKVADRHPISGER